MLPGSVLSSMTTNISDRQIAADASALWDATEGGLSGWGTDEETIWNVLNGKSAEDIATLSRAFQDNYGRDLMQVLESELSGAELDRARALMRGSGNQAEADAIVIQDEIDDTFVDEQRVLGVIESRQGQDRDRIAIAYAEKNGGPADLPGAKSFLLDRLEQGGLEGDDLTRARALLLPDGGDVAGGQARADAAKAKVAVDGMGTDEQTLKDLFAGRTPTQIAAIESAYQQAYGYSLRDRLNEELSGSDHEQIFHLLDPAKSAAPAAQGRWAATQDAMKLHEAIDGAGTDEQALRDVLGGKTPEQLQAISSAYRERYGVDLREDLRGDLSGDDADEILNLLNAPAANGAGAAEWQINQDAIRLHAAVDGAGTDEATIREILGSRSKGEIDAIARTYREKYGEDLRSRLADELDGREQVELLDQLFDRGAIDLQGDPRAAIAEQIRRSREVQAYEQDGGWDPGDAQKLLRGDQSFETDSERLDRTLNKAEQALQAGDLETAARYAGFSEENVRTLIATKDQASELAATGAAVVAATAATVATAGTASPLMVIALSGTAAGASAGATYGTMNPQAGTSELLRQVTIATASGATGAVPIGRGGTLAASFADDSLRVAARPGLRATVTDGAWVGGQSGFADGVTRTASQSETWQGGVLDGLGKVAMNGTISAGGGVLAGGATAAVISPLVRPLQRMDVSMPVRSPAARPDVPSAGYLPQTGIPATEIDSGSIAAMIKKFASPAGLREFADAVSSTPRVKRHNTSAWITSRIDARDYTKVEVPVASIRSQHSVDGAAVEKTSQRAASIHAWLTENPHATSMNMNTLDTLAGSTGSIKVGWHSDQRFITLDGVGRVEALREALRRYEATEGVPHPLQSVETYAVRLTDSEYQQLYKTSTYFRDAAGVQRAVPEHDLVPFTAVMRFAAGTAMNSVKQVARSVMHHLPVGSAPPDRRLPADLFQPPRRAGGT